MTHYPTPFKPLNINWQLLGETLDAIEAEPQRWNQGSYIGPKNVNATKEVCNTTMCTAGWAMVVSGKFEPGVRKYIEHRVYEGDREYYAIVLTPVGSDPNASGWYGPDYGYEAAKLLGFDAILADRIFMNTTPSGDSMNPAEWRTRVYCEIAMRLEELLDDAAYENVRLNRENDVLSGNVASYRERLANSITDPWATEAIESGDPYVEPVSDEPPF